MCVCVRRPTNRYNGEFEGVLVSYTDAALAEPSGRIVQELPYIHFAVDVTVGPCWGGVCVRVWEGTALFVMAHVYV